MDGLTEFKADREKALKAHIANMPKSYFRRGYVDTEGEKTVNVAWLDGVLAKFNKRVTNKILQLIHHATDEIYEHGLRVLAGRIKELEAEVAALKAAPPPTLADSYKGIWQPGPYERGSVCTNRGALWLCLRATSLKPGASDADTRGWTLIVKAGKDGRDADTRAPEAA